jgi:hypothetical protein
MAGAEPPRQSQGFLYLDTSALVKLLVREAESDAIEAELLVGQAATALFRTDRPRVTDGNPPRLSLSEQAGNLLYWSETYGVR